MNDRKLIYLGSFNDKGRRVADHQRSIDGLSSEKYTLDDGTIRGYVQAVYIELSKPGWTDPIYSVGNFHEGPILVWK